MLLTYQYRIKDSGMSSIFLDDMARSVNFVWNYCNETSFDAIRNKSEWLGNYDLDTLTAGTSKDLGLASRTIQAITSEYVNKRRQFKKRKLRWRSKKSLGWVPFKGASVRVGCDHVTYYGKTFRFWKSRGLPGPVKTGSFSQDARGRWYVNFTCEVETESAKGDRVIGIDLGCKDQISCSDEQKIRRDNLTKIYEEKLAKAQRAKRLNQVRNVHAKIANKRKDWAHKATTELVKSSKKIVVGNIRSKQLMRTKMAKTISDAAFAQIKSMLAYKAIRHQVDYKEVNENGTTITCSVCLEKTGPSGLSGLSVREWVCSACQSLHDRDINAAKNILRLGH